MARAEYENKSGGIRFEDNPLGYCQAIYSEALKENEKDKAVVIENREFFEGYDKELEERANDPNVNRSCKFVHESRNFTWRSSLVSLRSVVVTSTPRQPSRRR